MQTRNDPGKSVRYSFDSLHELGEYIERTKRRWPASYSVDDSPAMDWDLNAGYDASVVMARDGWLKGAQKLQNALKAFAPATPAPDTKTDFYGFRPHVPRFCAGAPDNMIRHTPQPDSGFGKVLTLAVPVNAIAFVGAREMSNFGVAVTQYVNQLETNGIRVELTGMIVSTVGSSRLAHSWIVKRADQPLDLAVVAFSIGHPAMFRRLGFALRERSACAYVGYGSSVPAEFSDLINPTPGTVILNGMTQANKYAPTPEDAFEYVSRQIEATMAKQEL